MKTKLESGEFWRGDCLELMRDIPDGSVDMILCDLPYGTTACKWDAIIPFEPLWEQYWRVCKPNAAIVLTASQPFTTALIGSQIKHFKYCWIWYKNQPSGFGAANVKPMSAYEDIAVFGKGKLQYNKQPTKSRITDRPLGRPNKRGRGKSNGVYGGLDNGLHRETILSENVNPRNVLEIDVEPRAKGYLHPTQKPVALFEYLIRTYTNPGELVLDNTAGSGTTAIAALNTGRKWVCIEKDETYYEKAVERVRTHLV